MSNAGFFVFPNLSVRREGSYCLKLSLFKVIGNDVRHCKNIYSMPFYVYTAKMFPGVEGVWLFRFSSIKIPIRKDISTHQGRHAGVGVGVGGGRPLASGAGSEHAHEFLFRVVPRTKSMIFGAGMEWEALEACARVWWDIHVGEGVSIFPLPHEADDESGGGAGVGAAACDGFAGCRITVRVYISVHPCTRDGGLIEGPLSGGSGVGGGGKIGGGGGDRDGGEGCVPAGGQGVSMGAEVACCAPICGSDWIPRSVRG
ncbi:hypothetical protein K438DRAFT_1749639 [Mycena galopus ATCC 62051]|nr:hypothetical protein K438DRAFT_1749639 [Mycena galopus ATCC 62051]